LYLENNWNWNEKYPVIRISFDTTFKNAEELNEYIKVIQDKYAKNYQVKLHPKHIGTRMMKLIENISEKTNKKLVLISR